MVIKVDTCLFISKTVIYVVYVYYCIFWAHSQSDIDKVMNSFKEDGPSYNWGHSKGDSVSELLVVDIKRLHNGAFQFYQTGLIHKVLEDTYMEHCKVFPITTKVEAPIVTDDHVYKSKRDCLNAYASVIGVILYLASNTRPDFSLLLISVPVLLIIPRHHIRLL